MKHIPGNILSPLHWYTIRLSLKPMKDRQGVHVVLADKKYQRGTCFRFDDTDYYDLLVMEKGC